MDGVQFLALLTLTSNIALAAILFVFILSLINKKSLLWKKIRKLLVKEALLAAFIVSLTATAGSLYFSEVKGFNPCKLCWIQRIFMYPLPFIIGTAIYKKTRDVVSYVLPLSVIGIAIAAYHYIMQVSPDKIIPCSTVGFSVSCSERFFTYYNYITIPWMSLSAFVMITLLLFFLKDKKLTFQDKKIKK